MHVLTVDQGTSSLKTALWDADGRPVAEAAAPYRLDRPSPLIAEIDPERWWEALAATIADVLGSSGVPATDVAVVALDGIGWTLVATDEAFRPVTPAITWLDRRAELEAAELRALPEAERFVELDANPLDAAYITPKIRWLARHEPAAWERTRLLLTASGWLVARLTGEATCDLTQAYGFHCFDIAGERWDPVAAAALGIPLDRLPSLRRAEEIAGTVTSAAASTTGLAVGTPVLVGALDAAVGALGGGVTRPGRTQDQGGQAGGMGMSIEGIVVEPRLILSHHVLPGQYLLQSGTVGGGALTWFRDLLGAADGGGAVDRGGVPSLERLDAEATAVPAGAGGLVFLPYLAGERTPLWSSTARGVLCGLSYATSRGAIARSIMEGCAFAVLDNLRLAEERGLAVSEWYGTGGATRSALWNQVKADVTGRPFVLARRAGGGEGGHGLGLFALGAAAVGLAGDPAGTVERLLPERRVFEPDPAAHARYAELFEIYRSLSRGLLPTFDALAATAAATGAAA